MCTSDVPNPCVRVIKNKSNISLKGICGTKPIQQNAIHSITKLLLFPPHPSVRYFRYLHIIHRFCIPVSDCEVSGLETVLMLLFGTSLVSVTWEVQGPCTMDLRPTKGSALPSALEPRCPVVLAVFLRSLFLSLSPEKETDTVEML